VKFKYIIIGFNILIVIFLLVIILTPVIILGSEYALKFWASGWPLALILFVSLIALNVFFLSNHRLFMLLEKEDWPALVDYLEHRIFDNNRYSPRLVRLLANSYIVLSDSAGVLSLEKKVAAAKPALLDRFALVFGSARILNGDPAGAADFFHARLWTGAGSERGGLKNPRIKDIQWVHFFYGFSLLLSRIFDKAGAEFRSLALASDDFIVTGLSAWFLFDTLCKFSADPDECRDIARKGRLRVTAKLKNIQDWRRETVKIESEVHTAIIKKYIDQCALWVYQGE